MTLRPYRAVLLSLFLVTSIGCGDDDGPGVDGGGTPGVDGGGTPGVDGGGSPVDGGIDGGGACVPTVEICGDRMDQNCDGRDTSCGDSDMDGIDACRAGDDLTRCDCDDSRSDVRPPFGGLPGARELCDSRDNDCDGRVDESAECCAGCAAVEPRNRADVCLATGECDCSTAAGTGPCPTGQTCCVSGCVDTNTDFDNCGSCQTMCTPSADRCVAGECSCGGGDVCEFITECNGGSCG
ncbi:MAG: hypothetical protein H6721_20110 [Sandaracinus sp.]|nr:hypothetical protein [Sandaracinus sp.]MCB9617530.1 hypothetical protein [Sandaracinus sp.]MCB9634433.1 hypothetical protein [Sandaracinus sp.]